MATELQASIDGLMVKPVVHYKDGTYIVEGQRAEVVPVDHPDFRLNGTVCWTSRVVKYDQATGNFETKNTIYRPYKEPSNEAA